MLVEEHARPFRDESLLCCWILKNSTLDARRTRFCVTEKEQEQEGESIVCVWCLYVLYLYILPESGSYYYVTSCVQLLA